MILNLTDMIIEGTVVPEGADAQLLFEALDGEHVDEAMVLIMSMEPSEVIVDISEEFFEELREELDEVVLTLGKKDDDERT
ncbi:hypothetical protein VPHD148_0201 [Vibrio phage D148]